MALWIYTLIIITYFFNKKWFSCVCRFFSLRSPFFTPSFPSLLFSSTFLLPSPLPVFSSSFLIKIQRNLHFNYFYYKDTSPFRLSVRKNDLSFVHPLVLSRTKRPRIFTFLISFLCSIQSWATFAVKRSACFLVPVEHRDKDTLLPIIRAHILPGTRVMSDKWKVFDCLQNEGYIHLTVN